MRSRFPWSPSWWCFSARKPLLALGRGTRLAPSHSVISVRRVGPLGLALLAAACHPGDERRPARPPTGAPHQPAAEPSHRTPANLRTPALNPPRSPAPALGAPSAAPTLPASVLASLTETGCFGSCPVYTVTIYADGRVLYEGNAFVKVVGQRSNQLTAVEL